MPLNKHFSTHSAAPETSAAVERPTLLVVDDEPEILKSLDFLLGRTYCRVLTANSAEQALELLKSHTVSVIISDQRMPKMTGVDLFGQAVTLSPDSVRILITGYADIEDVIQAVNKGKVFFYVEKPWNVLELEAVIRTAVEHHQLLRERRALIAELESRVEQRTRELQLRNRQLQAQEARQRHLACELHEEISQSLIAVKWNLETLQRRPELKPGMASLKDSIGAVEEVLQKVRNLALDLSPSLLDDLGLLPTLRWYADRQTQQAGLAVRVHAALPVDLRLPSMLEVTCFRIVQAALGNVIRHAQAREVYIEVRRHDAELELIIRDDGSDFDVRAARDRVDHGEGLGLLGMEERILLVGGRLTIDSAPGRGTEIRARLPLGSPRAHTE